MTPSMSKEDAGLLIKRNGSPIVGAVAISQRVASEEQNDRTFREAQEKVVGELSSMGRSLKSLDQGEVDTSLGRGVERTWAVPGTSAGFRMVLVPICAGTGSILFVETYGDPYARQVLDKWMGSFRFTDGRNLKACDYLDPK
jgi:hypothetical protein